MIFRAPHRLLFALMLWAVFGWAGTARADTPPPVTVFAAASLKNALDEVAHQFETSGAGRISLSYAGSSALARQIQYGAPAQIFLSANTTWMDVLERDGLIDAPTRVDLLSNRLVLITPQEGDQGADIAITIAPDMNLGMDLVAALGTARLAMALVDAVPAGIYGRAALQSLGVWDAVQGHVAQTDNVRAALRLVVLGEAPLGIVYATDAHAEPRVRVVGTFPKNSHPPILYPVARVTGAGTDTGTDAAQAFFDYLAGPQARAVFTRHGFGRPGSDPSASDQTGGGS